MAISQQETILEAFFERFGNGANPAVYRAPGRVNLIGEHTDYNLGFVFPIALKMACQIAIAPAEDGMLRIYSRESGEEFSIPAAEIAEAQPRKHWSDYPLGVAQQLLKAGFAVPAAKLYIASDVPGGSGLSSSASLEIATAVALLNGNSMPKVELAKLGQRAEREFVGMPCGIMDQYASVFGREGAAMRIDCRSLVHVYVKLPAGVKIVAVNSMVKHELGSSAYRERVAECAEAVASIQAAGHPEVQSLRDVSPELFERVQAEIPDLPRRRAQHVVAETQRALDLGTAAEAGDLHRMGELFVASHRSLQHDYEVSCEELDFLVDTALAIPGVYGARMTGGGFGGCTVNLVAPEAVQAFHEKIAAAYEQRFGLVPAIYDCEPAEGAGRLV